MVVTLDLFKTKNNLSPQTIFKYNILNYTIQFITLFCKLQEYIFSPV